MKREAGAWCVNTLQGRRCPRNGKRDHERRRPLCAAREGAVWGRRVTACHSPARRPARTLPGGSRRARPNHVSVAAACPSFRLPPACHRPI